MDTVRWSKKEWINIKIIKSGTEPILHKHFTHLQHSFDPPTDPPTTPNSNLTTHKHSARYRWYIFKTRYWNIHFPVKCLKKEKKSIGHRFHLPVWGALAPRIPDMYMIWPAETRVLIENARVILKIQVSKQLKGIHQSSIFTHTHTHTRDSKTVEVLQAYVFNASGNELVWLADKLKNCGPCSKYTANISAIRGSKG